MDRGPQAPVRSKVRGDGSQRRSHEGREQFGHATIFWTGWQIMRVFAHPGMLLSRPLGVRWPCFATTNL
jgi:hypothetical protein